MSDEYEEVTLHADPKRPYKAYATLVAAFLSSLLASELPFNIWARAFLAAVLAALTVYLVPNPIVAKLTKGRQSVSDDPSLF